jgi:uncharacterized protein DUF4760
MAGTHEDAMLMMELAKWGAMEGVAEANRHIHQPGFDPDKVSAHDPHIQKVLLWYETVGTLVKNGLLDSELVYDWLYVKGTWDKVGPAAKRAREEAGVPQMFENFEALAEGWNPA